MFYRCRRSSPLPKKDKPVTDFRLGANADSRLVALFLGDWYMTFTPAQAREIGAAFADQANIAEGNVKPPVATVAKMSRRVS